jgi:hypothetical protein
VKRFIRSAIQVIVTGFIFLSFTKPGITKSLSHKKLYAFSPENKDKIKEFIKANKTGGNKDVSYLRKLTEFLGQIVNQ